MPPYLIVPFCFLVLGKAEDVALQLELKELVELEELVNGKRQKGKY